MPRHHYQLISRGWLIGWCIVASIIWQLVNDGISQMDETTNKTHPQRFEWDTDGFITAIVLQCPAMAHPKFQGKQRKYLNYLACHRGANGCKRPLNWCSLAKLPLQARWLRVTALNKKALPTTAIFFSFLTFINESAGKVFVVMVCKY